MAITAGKLLLTEGMIVIKKLIGFFKKTNLSLTRKVSQKIVMVRDDEVIEIKIIRIKPDSVKMGISSNKELVVTKEEDIKETNDIK